MAGPQILQKFGKIWPKIVKIWNLDFRIILHANRYSYVLSNSVQSLGVYPLVFEKFGGKIFLGPPNISPNFGYRVPNFFILLEVKGVHISAKFRGPLPNRGSQGANQIFQFFGWWSSFTKNLRKWGMVRYIAHSAYCSGIKLETYSVRTFAISFPKSRYGSPNFANFAIFEIFSKFNASFLSKEITQGDQTCRSCRTLTCLATL